MSTPSFLVETIDVATAHKYLERNLDNRKLNAKRVDLYAKDIASGRWQLSGESIAFDRNGLLINGQHRLHAIIKAGKAAQFLVARGLESAVKQVIDTGGTRTGANALQFAGQPRYATQKAAMARIGLAQEAGELPTALSAASAVTNAAIVEWVERNHELVELGIEHGNRVYATTGGSIAAICKAFMDLVVLNAEEAIEFYDRLANLRTSGTGDPINALVRKLGHLRTEGTCSGSQIQAATLYSIFRAWNEWMAGNELSIIRHRTGTHVMKMPTPVSTRTSELVFA